MTKQKQRVRKAVWGFGEDAGGIEGYEKGRKSEGNVEKLSLRRFDSVQKSS